MRIGKEVIAISCVRGHCRTRCSGAFKEWYKTDAELSQPRFSEVFL